MKRTDEMEDPRDVVRDALKLAVRNTNTRLYLLRVDADDVTRDSLKSENKIYANALSVLDCI